MSEQSEDGTQHREPLPEEQNGDNVAIEVTEYASIRLESELLALELDSYNDNLQAGLHVTRDGTNIGLGSGTVNENQTPHMVAFHSLTPEQAREIGDALHEAAEKSQESMENNEVESDPEGFLRRLLG